MSIQQTQRVIAVVDYWPEIENAETECILRIRGALQELDCQCLPINRHGYLIEDPLTHVDELQVEFVLALHFDSAKAWNAFTYYALWNPLDFYFQWNYREKSENILSHDAFLSCGSAVADDHARRLLAGAGRSTRESFFTLFHATHEPVLPPAVTRGKLFYCGINWEALTGRGGRHHELLKQLDQKGMLDIYGPEIFQNVKVWDGYDSYQGSIPFDGKSLISSVARSGIGLVLSSEAHIRSGLMSSRLFECLSAGVPIICDQNKFASDNFGDSLFYIDTSEPVHSIVNKIEAHVHWIIDNPDRALEKAARAQEIYKQRFSLVHNFKNILSGGPHLKNDAANYDDFCTIFIADDCDAAFAAKIRRFSAYASGKSGMQIFALIPQTSSTARENDVSSACPGIQVVRYRRDLKNYYSTAIELINHIGNIFERLPENSIFQIIPAWERPTWSAIHAMRSELAAHPELAYIRGGFSVIENVAKPNEGKAVFVRRIPLTSIMDANANFSCSANLYRRTEAFRDVFNMLKYTPYFWQRLISVGYHRFGKGKASVHMAAVVDQEYYVNYHRISDVDQLLRESEMITDVLGSEYVDKNMRAPIAAPSPPVHPMALVSQFDNTSSRALLVKLFDSLKVPKIFAIPIQWMWKKKAI